MPQSEGKLEQMYREFKAWAKAFGPMTQAEYDQFLQVALYVVLAAGFALGAFHGLRRAMRGPVLLPPPAPPAAGNPAQRSADQPAAAAGRRAECPAKQT